MDFQKKCVGAAIMFLFAGTALASPGPVSSEEALDVTTWPNVYEAPGMEDVSVTSNILYFEREGIRAHIDLYRPAGASPGQPLPAVIIINGVGLPAMKDWNIYSSWARLMATEGLIAITMEAHPGIVQEEIAALLDYLQREGSRIGVDADRLGIFAASANTVAAGQYVMNSAAAPGIRTAAFYYGLVPAAPLRPDLPMLFVVAEADMRSGMAGGYPAVWSRIMEAGAPWTLVFASDQPHGFDGLAPTAESRRIVQNTLAYLRIQLGVPAAPPEVYPEERAAMAAVYMNDPERAVAVFRDYLVRHPDSRGARERLGGLLVQTGNVEEALPLLETAARNPTRPQVHVQLGQAYLAANRPAEAAASLEKAIEAGLSGGPILNQLAQAQLQAGRFAESADSFRRGVEAGNPAATGYYNMACAYSRGGQIDAALTWLSRAIEAGFNDRELLTSDVDLANVRDDPRFAAILSRVE